MGLPKVHMGQVLLVSSRCLQAAQGDEAPKAEPRPLLNADRP